jgi:hypothetical protein
MGQQNYPQPAGTVIPLPLPGRPDGVRAPGRRDHDIYWWLPQLIALGTAFTSSVVGWVIAAVPLGLWATQGCFGGDAVPGTRCPSAHYLGLGVRLYTIPALLWAGCWLLPHGVRWRRARIVLAAMSVMAVVAVPLVATWLAFDHMHAVSGL